MVKKESKPYGHIYVANYPVNGKNYVGKTKIERWAEDKNPIQERWKEEADIAKNKAEKGLRLRHIENAIVKYGSENFILFEVDKAYNREELNIKEQNWIKKLDSMNREKGYNMTEGGEGGIKSPEVNERMTKINQEIARNPEVQEKMSRSISEKWGDPIYQENVSMGVTNKWQESKYRERQFTARVEGKREIQNKREFLKDIQDMKKKEINVKYDMTGKSINKRIEEILGHHGVKNYSEAKKYLKDKDLDDLVKDINERLNDRSQESNLKKEISNKREFLEDILNMKSKDIVQKYNMNRATVNLRIREMLGEHGVKNYTEAKEYLKEKNLDDVVKDITERLSDQTQKYEGTTEISNKQEFLEDIQNLQKNEIDHKYGMDGKTINNKIEGMLGEHGVKDYTDAKEFLKDKDLNEVLKEIEERETMGRGSLQHLS